MNGCLGLNIEFYLVEQERPVKAVFNRIYQMCRVREIGSSIFVLMRSTSLVFKEVSHFLSTEFALSADRLEIVGLYFMVVLQVISKFSLLEYCLGNLVIVVTI